MIRLVGPLAIAMVASSLVTSPASAEMSPGAAAAVGALGGLAVGGVIGGAMASGPYYPGKRVYTAPPPPPVYYAPPPRRVYVSEEVEPRCYVKRRRYVDEFGDVIVRRIRICD
ncbi:MAG: hypothetical protein JWR08_876 [Enterovirga sp.]|nr:hypothetical protein [Enterovirga sp.]